MQLSITFKNVNSSNYLKSYIKEKLDRFDKFLYSPTNADVVLKAENITKIVEVNLKGGRLGIHAKERHTDMQAAIDLVLDKVKKQIVKGKGKLQAHRA